jgi:hypothetical protein
MIEGIYDDKQRKKGSIPFLGIPHTSSYLAFLALKRVARNERLILRVLKERRGAC